MPLRSQLYWHVRMPRWLECHCVISDLMLTTDASVGWPLLLNRLLQIRSTTASHVPGMRGQRIPRRVFHAMNSLVKPTDRSALRSTARPGPSAGSSGVGGSPRMPRTVRTTLETGARFRPKRIAVGVPCPGTATPEQSTTCVRSSRGSTSAINFAPNSRFIKLFATIRPTKPAPAPPSRPARDQKIAQ